MKKTWSIIALMMILIFSAQAFGQEHPLTGYLPANPLVVLSARDFDDTFSALTKLEALKAHRESKDRERFQRSKLALKLKDRVKLFSDFIGHDLNLETLSDLSGKNLAFALYDIGELRFLLISDLDAKGQAALSYLSAYNDLPERKVGDRVYKVKENTDQGLSFAMYRTDSLLVVSNDVTLLENALSLVEDPNNRKRFADQPLWKKALGTGDSALSMKSLLYLDMAKLNNDNYFRYYWAYNNLDDFADMEAVVAGMDVSSNRVSERRIVIGPKTTAGNLPTAENLKGAIWSARGPGKDPLKEIEGFFTLHTLSEAPWADAVQGRLLASDAVQTDRGTVEFHKGMALVIDEKVSAKDLIEAIEKGSRKELLVVPEGFGFVNRAGGISSFVPIKGMPGIHVVQKGNLLFIANDPALLMKMTKTVHTAESDIELAGRVDIGEQGPVWAEALRQMGPNATFSYFGAGRFFSEDFSGLLESTAKFKEFSFRSHHIQNDVMIQTATYGK